MESKGLVTSRLGEPTAERGGRAKRFFQVTAAGRLAVRRVQEVVGAMAKGLKESRGTT
jgi:DNA-binding PadR family transcriptional regulator